MMLGARTAAWAKSGGSMPTAKDYVQDGLLDIRDGIENAAWGVHSSSIDWFDLTGNNDKWTMTGYQFSDKGLILNGQTTRTKVGNINSSVINTLFTRANAGQKNTFEICMHFISKSEVRVIFANTYSQHDKTAYYFALNNSYLAGGCFGSWNVFLANKYPEAGEYFTASGITDKNWSDGYYNAQFITGREAMQKNMNKNTALYFMPSISAAWVGKVYGEIYCIRVYARELSATEIAHNYAIDKARFNLQ